MGAREVALYRVDPVGQCLSPSLVEQDHLLLDPDPQAPRFCGSAEVAQAGPVVSEASPSRDLALRRRARVRRRRRAGVDEAAEELRLGGRVDERLACHWTPIRKPFGPDRLDRPVGRPGADPQPLPSRRRLVVEGVDVVELDLVAADRRGERGVGSISTGWLVSCPGGLAGAIAVERSGRRWWSA